MAELFKNIGLGIFVNGAYAFQFTDETLKGLYGAVEGIIIMGIILYQQQRKAKND